MIAFNKVTLAPIPPVICSPATGGCISARCSEAAINALVPASTENTVSDPLTSGFFSQKPPELISVHDVTQMERYSVQPLQLGARHYFIERYSVGIRTIATLVYLPAFYCLGKAIAPLIGISGIDRVAFALMISMISGMVGWGGDSAFIKQLHELGKLASEGSPLIEKAESNTLTNDDVLRRDKLITEMGQASRYLQKFFPVAWVRFYWKWFLPFPYPAGITRISWNINEIQEDYNRYALILEKLIKSKQQRLPGGSYRAALPAKKS